MQLELLPAVRYQQIIRVVLKPAEFAVRASVDSWKQMDLNSGETRRKSWAPGQKPFLRNSQKIYQEHQLPHYDEKRGDLLQRKETLQLGLHHQDRFSRTRQRQTSQDQWIGRHSSGHKYLLFYVGIKSNLLRLITNQEDRDLIKKTIEQLTEFNRNCRKIKGKKNSCMSDSDISFEGYPSPQKRSKVVSKVKEDQGSISEEECL